jgi:hypothetical protein
MEFCDDSLDDIVFNKKSPEHIIGSLGWFMVFKFQQYFSYILAVSFIGGENHCCKSLTSLLDTTLCDLSLSVVYGRSVGDDSLDNIVFNKKSPPPCCLFKEINECKESWNFYLHMMCGVLRGLVHGKNFLL